MNLIYVLEIFPSDYSDEPYNQPDTRSKNWKKEWMVYWSTCLSQKKLEHIKPIEIGSIHADLTQFSVEDLKPVIKNHLEDVDIWDFEEQVGRLCGGIVMKVEDKFPITPTCCVDIGNIRNWVEIFKDKSKVWKTLWVGHPWVFHRFVGESIEFSKYYEKNIEDIEEVQPLVTVKACTLQSELEKIKKQQIEIELKLKIALEELGYAPAKQIANLMTGNW